ncbi:MAG: hypothetical protein IJM51_06000 [Clostridia bacterium]|nr:hypothetical protein [Clostridia bacterium]
MKSNKKNEETPGMSAEQIRRMREQERIDSVLPPQPVSKKTLYACVNYMVAFGVGAVILIAFYYARRLVSYLSSELNAYLSGVDNSSGFLSDMETGLLHLILFALVAFLFGFALDINYAGHGRPREVWGRDIRFILPAAFGSGIIYLLINHFISGSSFRAGGSILSQCLYYFTMIVIVPAGNVLLFLVLPSSVIRMLLTAVSETKEKAELPLTLSSAVVMAIAMLGITPNHIENYGFLVVCFTLIQCVCCSLLYHRTNVIKYTILLYSGVSAMYLALAAFMYFIK